MQIITNFAFSVDTFFLIGGIVNCYVSVKDEEKSKSRNIIYRVKHRLWRILPAYAAVPILIYPVRKTFRGPGYSSAFVNNLESACDNNWWMNFLFIHNFSDFSNTCMPHTWYMAAEFQLFLIACVIIKILLRSPLLGILLNFVMIFISIVFSVAWTELHLMHAAYITINFHPQYYDVYWSWYTQTMVHAGPYFTGVLVGYMLAKKKELTISKTYQVLGWLLAVFTSTCIIFATKKWNSGVEPTKLEDVLYSGFSKIMFTIAVAWTIVCCAKGYGGIVNDILSWRIWTPLSRISFCVYLVSPIIQGMTLGSVKTLRESSTKEWVWRFLGDYIVSAFTAFFFFVLVENPFINIEKMLTKHKRNGNTSKKIKTKGIKEDLSKERVPNSKQ